jgi:nitrate reductase NapD
VNICGVLVHARPGLAATVRRLAEALPGVEVHHVGADDRLVLTVEDRPGAPAGDTLLALHRIEGVVAAALTYHHFEPDEGTDDAAVQA